MAKNGEKDKCTCENCQCNFGVMSGFRFGFGFFLANLVGVLIIGVIAWVIILVAQYFGLIF